MDSFQMPPALAGKRGEVSFDREGLRNWGAVTGGIGLSIIGGVVALKSADLLLGAGGGDGVSEARQVMEVQ